MKKQKELEVWWGEPEREREENEGCDCDRDAQPASMTPPTHIYPIPPFSPFLFSFFILFLCFPSPFSLLLSPSLHNPIQ